MNKLAHQVIHRDLTTFLWINRSLETPFLDRIMPKVTHLGGFTSTIIISLLFLLNKNQFYHSIGVHLTLSLLTCTLIVKLFKISVHRQRPYQVNTNVLTRCKQLNDPSFPSGHTSAAFCIATVLSMSMPIFLPIFYFLAGVVAFSRVYLGMHYPLDVLIGVIIGSVTALLFA